MKFGQLKEITRQIYLFKNAENETETSPDLILFFKKAFSEVIASGIQVNFNIFR